MRFKKSEHKVLVQLIEEKGLETKSFFFSKKRGVLHVQHPDKKEAFTFHRKNSSRLNANKQWEDHEAYFFNLPHKGAKEISWEEVCEAFSLWLP
ncbi:MAG: hypothetical protein R8P61_08550 [Bacteroidia bacterium]|nr:hypothetical protein [Bacteroidia bacterium]